jgi:hypothetical protein
MRGSAARLRLFFRQSIATDAEALAELAESHNYGPNSGIINRDATAARAAGLYYRKLEPWSVFVSSPLMAA